MMERLAVLSLRLISRLAVPLTVVWLRVPCGRRPIFTKPLLYQVMTA